METFDVVIVGAGLAGLHFAETVGGIGCRVLLVDRKSSVDAAVHTSGIFVRKTIEDFALDEDCLGPWVRAVSLYSPRRHCIRLESRLGEFRVGQMARLYRRKLSRAVAAGVQWRGATRFIAARQSDSSSVVTLATGAREYLVRARVLIGADGGVSRVAKALHLGENREEIVGVEDVYASVRGSSVPAFHCFIDPDLAPGYIAWIVDDGIEIHVGVGGYAAEFNPLRCLGVFSAIARTVVDIPQRNRLERRGGRIPVGGILSQIGCVRGLLIGDAAGAPSPLTAGGLDACYRLSDYAATIAARMLDGDPKASEAYRGDSFKARFLSRTWMRKSMRVVRDRWLIESAFALMRTPLLQGFVRHVFFSRGSFPDTLARTLRTPSNAGSPVEPEPLLSGGA